MHIDAIGETNGKGWLIWAAQCPGAFARGATENEAPVSYTHLDVYKRQPP